MIGLIKSTLPTLRGGPAMDNATQHRVDFGSAVVELITPWSVIQSPHPKPVPKSLNLKEVMDPRDPLFAEGVEHRTHHPAIEFNATTWVYVGPWWRCGSEPYVLVTQTWAIEQVKGDTRLNPSDLQQLQDYLEEDYWQFFESEGGPNAESRRKAYEYFSKRPLPVEEYAEDIKAVGEHNSAKLPNDYRQVALGNMNWLRFTWDPHGVQIPNHMFYCCPLDERHILRVEFCFTRMVPGTDQYWFPTAEKDIERVMTGTRVHYRALPDPRTGTP